MRCLYCGKELALLKRWTGGGEFCSDAHRQQYQDEYNQLALNRLLQAKPPGEKSAPEDTKPAQTKPEPVPPTVVAAPPPPPVAVEPVPVAEAPAPMRAEAAPVVEEEPDPAEPAGYIVEQPEMAMAEIAAIVVSQPGFEEAPQLEFPHREISALAAQLASADGVDYEPLERIADYAVRRSERKIELRDFVRTAPVVQFDLRAAGEVGMLETSEKPMDLFMLPQAPGDAPALWTEPGVEFTVADIIIDGDLARIAFATSGFPDAQGGEIQLAPRVNAVRPEPVQAPPPAVDPVELQPAVEVVAPHQTIAVETIEPEPAPEPEPVVEQDPVPLTATKPLPVTLHGLAAGRGKPVQVFPSAVVAGVDLQVPRSTSMPVRAVMTFGPAPVQAEVKPATAPKPELKKPSRPDPRFQNGKGRKSEARVSEPEKKESEPVAVAEAVQEKPKPVEAKEVKAEPKVEPKKAPEPPIEPKKAALPAPLAAPYDAADLRLPNLTMNASNGFWGNLPVAGKAGLSLAILLALGAAIYFGFIKSSSGAAASSGPRIVEAGPAITAGDAGWITDWGAEPGVRKTHEISILRPSMNLTDYRVQFQAQIETKALGWVYRAKDPKNYYVNRLEIVKPGLEPKVALVRFAVINGEEETHSQFPLPMPVRIDTLYKIRFDAVGDHFTTYVQDQKVDDFTDGRVQTGGIGLYNLYGERMSLKGSVNVVPLVIKR